MFKRLSVVSFINTINKPSVKKAAHIPRGFLAAAVVVVRVDPAVRTGAVVLLAAVAADVLLLAEPVWFEAAVLDFVTRGRFSVVVWKEREKWIWARWYVIQEEREETNEYGQASAEGYQQNRQQIRSQSIFSVPGCCDQSRQMFAEIFRSKILPELVEDMDPKSSTMITHFTQQRVCLL